MKSIILTILVPILLTTLTCTSYAKQVSPIEGNQSWFGKLFDNDDAVEFKVQNNKKRRLELDIDKLEDEVRQQQQSVHRYRPLGFLEDRLERLERDTKRYARSIKRNENIVAELKQDLKQQKKIISSSPNNVIKIKEAEKVMKKINDEIKYLEEELKDQKHAVNEQIPLSKEEVKKEILKLNEVTEKLEKLRDNLDIKQTDLFEVDNKLSDLLNRDSLQNSFRLNISIAFTLLVAVVIIGFYMIAFKKDELAQNIFSGDKGIQFITLFLIIISIILFGIMGTLQSKELSALLGALSGYILGKTSTNRN